MEFLRHIYPGGCALTDIMRLFTDEDFQKERRREHQGIWIVKACGFTHAKMGDLAEGHPAAFSCT